MADILSQEEIDALLGALSSGELKAEDARDEASEKNAKVKAYDFFRPSKFSKEQIRTIYMMHETYGRLWSSKLAGQLRNYVSISVSAVDQVTYQEFMQSIPNPTITCTFSLSPLEGQALMEFSPTIGFPIIDRLLGGQGQSNVQSREITEIEGHVLSNLIDEGMIYLKEAWSSMIDLKPELIDLESNPLFVQIVPPADMILLITLECRIGEMSGIMNIVYPYVVLEPILSLLSDRVLYAVGTRGASKESRSKTTQILQNVSLKVSVELGSVKLTLRDLLALEADDLVILDTNTQEDLTVKVAGIHKFNCIPGLDGKHYAAQVTEVVTDSDLWSANPFDGGI
ncbi:MAG: flagellar motor switch protein FliM [bacterium]